MASATSRPWPRGRSGALGQTPQPSTFLRDGPRPANPVTEPEAALLSVGHPPAPQVTPAAHWDRLLAPLPPGLLHLCCAQKVVRDSGRRALCPGHRLTARNTHVTGLGPLSTPGLPRPASGTLPTSASWTQRSKSSPQQSRGSVSFDHRQTRPAQPDPRASRAHALREEGPGVRGRGDRKVSGQRLGTTGTGSGHNSVPTVSMAKAPVGSGCLPCKLWKVMPMSPDSSEKCDAGAGM